jgi:hypothetical protein
MAMSKCSGHSPTQGKTVVLDRLSGSVCLFCLECGDIQNEFFSVKINESVEANEIVHGFDELVQ